MLHAYQKLTHERLTLTDTFFCSVVTDKTSIVFECYKSSSVSMHWINLSWILQFILFYSSGVQIVDTLCSNNMIGRCNLVYAMRSSYKRGNFHPHSRTLTNVAGGTRIRDSSTNENPKMLRVHNGTRISRIVTATTTSFVAMQKICTATSLLEVQKLCTFRYKTRSKFTDHEVYPTTKQQDVVSDSDKQMTKTSRVHDTRISKPSLWTVNTLKKDNGYTFFGQEPEEEVVVGSWLLASFPGKDQNHRSVLFSPTVSRTVTSAVPLSLVSPGFSVAPLLHTEDGLQWVLTFIELSDSDEFGYAVNLRSRWTEEDPVHDMCV